MCFNGERIAKVDADAMGAVALQNRPQALRHKKPWLVPGDGLICPHLPVGAGELKCRSGCSATSRNRVALSGDKSLTDRMLTVRAQT